MTAPDRVAVLGAGIMGSCTALYLARRGIQVDVFDEEPVPCSGASRWNEGKIHLGYMYAASQSLETLHALLPGALSFKPLIEDLIGASIDQATALSDETYLVHRNSVIGAADVAAYHGQVAEVVRQHPHARQYVVDARASRVHRLTPAEVEAMTDPTVVLAGFRVLERSVNTAWIADRLTAALAAEPRVRLFMRHRVVDVPTGHHPGDRPAVATADEVHPGYDVVVNALWHGRPLVDQRVTGTADAEPNHRYRLALFVRTRTPVTAPSAVICAGPFGDIKSYSDRDFYLSWYPAGLVASGRGIEPPPVPALGEAERTAVARATFDALSDLLPVVRAIRDAAADVRIEGGWVYAQAKGTLDDPRSTLHRRDRLGVSWRGRYISVDTGKYSVAPRLAQQIARRVADGALDEA